MSTSNTITKTDLTNILNEVLLSPNYGGIYKASWTASSSSANSTPLTEDLIIPAGTYVINCISPVASVDFSLAIAGRYKEMNKSGDSFTIIYSCDEEVTFHVSSAQSAAVTFSYTDRGSLTAIQISQQGVATNVADYIVEQGTDGIWTYTKWNNGTYDAVYVGTVNMQTGSAMGGGYFHQTTSVLTPPSFSQTVKSLHGAANSAVLFSYVGHANDYSTYWWNASSTAVSNVSVRLEMHGTWK